MISSKNHTGAAVVLEVLRHRLQELLLALGRTMLLSRSSPSIMPSARTN